jgi:parallel beta-helix repeat protein
MKRILIAAAVAAGALVGAAHAGASTGFMLVTSSTTLTEDHNGPILIAGPSVTLDCAGHSVSGDGSGNGIAVVAADVTVKSCTVRSFSTGIYTNAARTQILANTTVGNGEGIRLDGAVDSTVAGNAANGSDLWGIIACCNAQRDTISGNTMDGNRLLGLALNHASHNSVVHNTATHNDHGYSIAFDSDFNDISHNTAVDNNHGFDFAFVADSTIEHNVSSRNGSGPDGGGFSFSDALRNRVAFNDAMDNGSTGFNLFFRNEANVFTKNHACGNYFPDALDASVGAVPNTWDKNHFCNSTLP